MSIDEKLPIANWPTTYGTYKVVQLELDGKQYLRFGAYEQEPHSVILMAFLEGLKIPHRDIRLRSGCDGPALSGERYKVFGMGKSDVEVSQKRATFFDKSFDYNLGIDATQLGRIRPLVPDWTLVHKT